MSSSLMSTYQPLPISFTHGKGAWLFDKKGEAYLDALSGIAVTALGHNHPDITATIHDQAQKLLHTCNLYEIDNQKPLADKLCALTGMDNVFFGNSGAEANEAAIKLSRLFGHHRGVAEPKMIVMEKSFHGRTLATLSATGNPKIQAGFEPLVQGYVRVPYDDIPAVEAALARDKDIVALMVEPIAGEGGIQVPSPDYLSELRRLADQYHCLLIVDEIQSGMGRTGHFCAYQQTKDLLPDILTLAKALGNGIPIGACLARGVASTLFKPGSHGSTFGGNPFATRVASTVLSVLERDHLITRAGEMGETLQALLKKRLADKPHVKAIRGKGLMIGIELDQPCRDLLLIGLEHRILFSITAEKVIRLLPPYIMTDDEIRTVAERVIQSIEHYIVRT